MSKIYLAGLDGSDESIRAATYAAQQAGHASAKLILAHAIEWSGFDILGPEELAERHKVRAIEIGRAQEHIIKPMMALLADLNLDIETVVHHGHAAQTLLTLMEGHKVGHIFIGRHGASRLTIAIVGSTTNSIMQASPVPITVVP
jgi:nucleotide-binding universal stress UspA family protein